MKNKLISFVLVLAMLISIVPSGIFAQGEETNNYCFASYDDNEGTLTYQTLPNNPSLPLGSNFGMVLSTDSNNLSDIVAYDEISTVTFDTNILQVEHETSFRDYTVDGWRVNPVNIGESDVVFNLKNGSSKTIKITVTLPDVGLYSQPEASAQNYISVFKYTDSNSAYIIVNPQHATVSGAAVITEIRNLSEADKSKINISSISTTVMAISVSGILSNQRMYPQFCIKYDGIDQYNGQTINFTRSICPILENGNPSVWFKFYNSDNQSVWESEYLYRFSNTSLGDGGVGRLYYGTESNNISLSAISSISVEDSSIIEFSEGAINSVSGWKFNAKRCGHTTATIKFSNSTPDITFPITVSLPYMGFYSSDSISEQNFISGRLFYSSLNPSENGLASVWALCQHKNEGDNFSARLCVRNSQTGQYDEVQVAGFEYAIVEKANMGLCMLITLPALASNQTSYQLEVLRNGNVNLGTQYSYSQGGGQQQSSQFNLYSTNAAVNGKPDSSKLLHQIQYVKLEPVDGEDYRYIYLMAQDGFSWHAAENFVITLAGVTPEWEKIARQGTEKCDIRIKIPKFSINDRLSLQASGNNSSYNTTIQYINTNGRWKTVNYNDTEYRIGFARIEQDTVVRINGSSSTFSSGDSNIMIRSDEIVAGIQKQGENEGVCQITDDIVLSLEHIGIEMLEGNAGDLSFSPDSIVTEDALPNTTSRSIYVKNHSTGIARIWARVYVKDKGGNNLTNGAILVDYYVSWQYAENTVENRPANDTTADLNKWLSDKAASLVGVSHSSKIKVVLAPNTEYTGTINVPSIFNNSKDKELILCGTQGSIIRGDINLNESSIRLERLRCEPTQKANSVAIHNGFAVIYDSVFSGYAIALKSDNGLLSPSSRNTFTNCDIVSLIDNSGTNTMSLNTWAGNNFIGNKTVFKYVSISEHCSAYEMRMLNNNFINNECDYEINCPGTYLLFNNYYGTSLVTSTSIYKQPKLRVNDKSAVVSTNLRWAYPCTAKGQEDSNRSRRVPEMATGNYLTADWDLDIKIGQEFTGEQWIYESELINRLRSHSIIFDIIDNVANIIGRWHFEKTQPKPTAFLMSAAEKVGLLSAVYADGLAEFNPSLQVVTGRDNIKVTVGDNSSLTNKPVLSISLANYNLNNKRIVLTNPSGSEIDYLINADNEIEFEVSSGGEYLIKFVDLGKTVWDKNGEHIAMFASDGSGGYNQLSGNTPNAIFWTNDAISSGSSLTYFYRPTDSSTTITQVEIISTNNLFDSHLEKENGNWKLVIDRGYKTARYDGEVDANVYYKKQGDSNTYFKRVEIYFGIDAVSYYNWYDEDMYVYIPEYAEDFITYTVNKTVDTASEAAYHIDFNVDMDKAATMPDALTQWYSDTENNLGVTVGFNTFDDSNKYFKVGGGGVKVFELFEENIKSFSTIERQLSGAGKHEHFNEMLSGNDRNGKAVLAKSHNPVVYVAVAEYDQGNMVKKYKADTSVSYSAGFSSYELSIMPYSYPSTDRIVWLDNKTSGTREYSEISGSYTYDCLGGAEIKDCITRSSIESFWTWSPIKVKAPDGYRILDYRINGNGRSFRGEIEGDFTLSFTAWATSASVAPSTNGIGVQRVVLQWENKQNPDDVIEERFNIYFNNYSLTNYEEMIWDTIPSDGYSLSVDTNGKSMNFEYIPETGFYNVSFDPNIIPTAEEMEAEMLIKAPAGAKYYKKAHHRGYSLYTPNVLRDNKLALDGIALEELTEDVVRFPVVDYGTYTTGAITAYYNTTSRMGGFIVEWFDAEEHKIGSSFIYGRTEGFINETVTKAVSEEPTEPVDAPTVVLPKDKLNFELRCLLYPQSGSGYFFKLEMTEADNTVFEREIILPYSFIGLNNYLEAKQMNNPIITHYNEDMERLESITGIYTEFGIKFVVNSFSPFTIQADRTLYIVTEYDANGKMNTINMGFDAVDPLTLSAGQKLIKATESYIPIE